MTTWQFTAGKWRLCSSVSLEDRAFRYGMSIFETIAIHHGRPLFLNEHFNRLVRAASDCGMSLSLTALPNVADLPDGVIRLYLTAGPGAPSDPFLGSLYALFEEMEIGCHFSPLRLMTSSAPYVPRPGGAKTGNYWQNVDALAAARRGDCEDALLYNPDGMVVCASMANIFFHIDNRWITPALETGARNGVVREWAVGKISADEALLKSEEVVRCTACFLTNSRIGVRAVTELDGRPLAVNIGNLEAAYREEILGS